MCKLGHYFGVDFNLEEFQAHFKRQRLNEQTFSFIIEMSVILRKRTLYSRTIHNVLSFNNQMLQISHLKCIVEVIRQNVKRAKIVNKDIYEQIQDREANE